jgi:cell division septation protein DedD
MEDKLKKQGGKSNDLSDIVLEKEKSNVDKTKKILLFAASLILLFLVALVVMKLFNKSPQNDNSTLAQVGEQMNHPVDESIDQISKKVEDTNSLFQQEPIVDDGTETDLKFEEMVRRLKAQDGTEEEKPAPAPAVVEKPVEKTKTAVKETKDLFDKKVDEIAKSVSKTKEHTTAKVVKAKEAAAKIIETKIVTPAPKAKKQVVPAPKEIIIDTKVSPVQTGAKLSTLSGYFIQVGATTASFPDRRYLQKIKNAGYDYVVHTTVVNGRKIKKILIGPFSSKNAAKRKLPAVQASINPSAYVYRVK